MRPLETQFDIPSLREQSLCFDWRPVVRLGGPGSVLDSQLQARLDRMRTLALSDPDSRFIGSSEADFQVKSHHTRGELTSEGTGVAQLLAADLLEDRNFPLQLDGWSFFGTDRPAVQLDPSKSYGTSQPHSDDSDPAFFGGMSLSPFTIWSPEASGLGTVVYVPHNFSTAPSDEPAIVPALSVPFFLGERGARKCFKDYLEKGIIRPHVLVPGPRWLFYPSVIHNRETEHRSSRSTEWRYSFRNNFSSGFGGF